MKKLLSKTNFSLLLVTLLFVAIFADAGPIYGYSVKWLQGFCWIFTSFLSFAIMLKGGEYLSAKDSYLMKWVCGLVFCADLTFAVGFIPGGFIIFFVVHSLLIKRNMSGWISFLKEERYIAILKTIVALAISMAIFKTVIWDMVRPHMIGTAFLYLGVVHGLICSLSIGAALMSIYIGKLPKINAVLVSIAVISLSACDAMIAISQYLPHDITYMVLDVVNGVLYKVFLILAPWSAYKMDRLSEIIKQMASIKSLKPETNET